VSRILAAWRVLMDAIGRFNRNDGAAMAGYIAFHGLLSIFPFLIFAATLIGILVGDDKSYEIIEALFKLAPEHVAMTLEPVVRDVLDTQSGKILTLAGLFAIVTASNGVNAFRLAFDRAYQVDDPRGFFKNRAIAIGLVFLGAIVAALLGISIILSPLLLSLAEKYSHVTIPAFAGQIIYAFGIAVFAAFVMVMHRTLPGRDLPGAWNWPGVAVTTLIWVMAAGGFSIYLTYTPTYSITYGTLSGVIITLMFFYITGATIIFGAEINAAMNVRHPRVPGRSEA
jgi:membrane protein